MRVLVGLAALSALGLAPLAADAATLGYSQFFPGGNSLDPAQSPQNFSKADWDGTTQSVALPQFDPALGTLTGVELLLYGNIVSSGSLKNIGGAAVGFGNYSASLDMSVLPPGEDALVVSPALFSFGRRSLAAGDALAFGAEPVNSADTGSTSIGSSFAPYVGTGSVVFPLSTEMASSSDYTGSDLRIVPDTAARAEVTITYAYDLAAVEVPEPASAALLGAGLLGLGLLRHWA